VDVERLENGYLQGGIRFQAFPLLMIQPPHNRYRELVNQVGDHGPRHQPDKSSSN
jgi:hypothetical protein